MSNAAAFFFSTRVSNKARLIETFSVHVSVWHMSNKREEAADVILNSLEKTEKAPDSKHSFFFDAEKEQNLRQNML